MVGDLEGGWALAFASGLAAASAVLSVLPEGGTAVAPDNAYSGTLSLIRERVDAGRAKVRAVEVSDTAATVAAADGADIVWLESPTNPLLDVADLPTLVSAAHAPGRWWWSTTPSPPRSCNARWSSAPTSSCTARPSCWPGTPTC